MKEVKRSRIDTIDISVWQIIAISVAAMACVFATVPLVVRHRQHKCDLMYVEKTIESRPTSAEQMPIKHRSRYVRQVNRDECSIVPPMCSATTSVATTSSTAPPPTTSRSTVSTVSVTRPVITAAPTTTRVTTQGPGFNTSGPYNSTRLPTFATPTEYSLRISCPVCFDLFSNPTIIPFNGQVTIQLNVSSAENYLVLHAKHLEITNAQLTDSNSAALTAVVSYLPELELIYLGFGGTPFAAGEATLQINYTGQVNQQDQTGFYREVFWKSVGEISYVLATNFQPIHARRAFPCFDEPQMQSTFNLILEHPKNSSVAASNVGAQSSDETSTTFEPVSGISTHELAWAILPQDEFIPVERSINSVPVTIWVRPELGTDEAKLDAAFDIITKAFDYATNDLNITSENFPEKLDLIGLPDLVLDEKASTSWGLLTFREEFLSVDDNFNSAERMQTTAKVIAEHIFQLWLSKVNWWNNIWFGKSLSSYLAYKMIEKSYPLYNLMEQFPIREMVPWMMDDGKPSIWPVSNRQLTTNAQILDGLAPMTYSKGAALLRLLERIVTPAKFQTAVTDAIASANSTQMLDAFYSSLSGETIEGSTVTVEEFLRSWLEEPNYPLVTIDFTPANGTESNASAIFRQTRYLGSYFIDGTEPDPNYAWKIYVECQLGGTSDENGLNLTGNVDTTTRKFLLETAEQTVEFEGNDYQWIKCNTDFYSYQVTEYVSTGDDPHYIWGLYDQLFSEDVFSSNDKADLINSAFILPHGGDIVTYDQTIELVSRLFNTTSNYIPFSVFIWHWNYLMGVEEHSKYFYNFKQFATRQSLRSFGFNVDNLLAPTTNHQERLIRSMIFELLCRVQNPDALNKATELFDQIPPDFFVNSTTITSVVQPEFLSTVLYYHLQNVNYIDQWDTLWSQLIENEQITAQQRQAIFRALGASKELWRLKSLLERGFDFDSNIIETQEFFDIFVSISQNPVGRDIVWNFYRHNYEDLIKRFGTTNRLFNQLIANIAQSFENEYYYFQMEAFIGQYPSSSATQQQAVDQILMNFEWLIDGLAENLDDAISGGDRRRSAKGDSTGEEK